MAPTRHPRVTPVPARSRRAHAAPHRRTSPARRDRPACPGCRDRRLAACLLRRPGARRRAPGRTPPAPCAGCGRRGGRRIHPADRRRRRGRRPETGPLSAAARLAGGRHRHAGGRPDATRRARGSQPRGAARRRRTGRGRRPGRAGCGSRRSCGSGAAGATPSAPVSLSTATAEQLDTLPGVGPVTAQKIVAFRQEHGPFSSVAQLDAIPGIGPARLDELRGLVVP